MEQITARLEERILDGIKCWHLTNDQPFVIDVEVRTASGTKVISRLPIGSVMLLVPGSEDDANIILHRAKGQDLGLRLV